MKTGSGRGPPRGAKDSKDINWLECIRGKGGRLRDEGVGARVPERVPEYDVRNLPGSLRVTTPSILSQLLYKAVDFGR